MLKWYFLVDLTATSFQAMTSLPETQEILSPTPRTTLKRHADRGTFVRTEVNAILDEALVCHLGVIVDGAPRVLPTAHVRLGEHVYVHGARANRLLAGAVAGPVCLTATLLDGIVFARSWMHHSMNFRSVVLYGMAIEVVETAEKLAALRALVDHVGPGRSEETRAPTQIELKRTLVLRIPIVEGSAKARSGHPLDDPEDLARDVWAGVLPLSTRALEPVPDPVLAREVPVSESILERARALAG